MSQRTTGWRTVFSSPTVYRFAQRSIGSDTVRQAFVRDYVRPSPGDHLLDIGCGTGDLAGMVADVEFVGHDPSADYVESARAAYPDAEFHVAGVGDFEPEPGRFDICVAKGVLHHLDDGLARELFAEAHRALRPGGRLVTMDPVLADGQSPIARFLALRDRGENVRTAEGYRSLAAPTFESVESAVRHDMLRVPYSHALLTCTRTD